MSYLRIVSSLSSATKHPFNKGLDKKLMENVHGGSTDDKVFKTACDYFGFFRLLAIICKVKYESKVDAHKLFQIRDPQRNLELLNLLKRKWILLPFCVLVLILGYQIDVQLLLFLWSKGSLLSHQILCKLTTITNQ